MRFLKFLLIVAVVVLAFRYLPSYWTTFRQQALSLDHLSSDVDSQARTLIQARDSSNDEDREIRDAAPMRPLNRVRGKPLLICLDTNANVSGDPDRFGEPPCIDLLMHQLPQSLMPERESEIGTLVGLTWGDRFMASYGTGAAAATAYLEICEIDVIDRESGARIASVTAIGGHPPQFAGRTDGSEVFGSRAESQVIDYVIALFDADHQPKSTIKRERGEILIIPEGEN